MTKPKIFVSAGRTWKPEQEEFVSSVEEILRNRGLDPCTVDRNDFAAELPLSRIKNLMSESAGVIVLAYDRLQITKGALRQGSENEETLDGTRFTTVWNQIEGGMAYAMGKTVLVIKESDLREEGLLEKSTGWYVLDTKIEKAATANKRFAGILDDWIDRVKIQQLTPKSDARTPQHSPSPEDVSLSAILKSLSPRKWWALGSAVFTVLVVITSAAYYLGSLRVLEKPTAPGQSEGPQSRRQAGDGDQFIVAGVGHRPVVRREGAKMRREIFVTGTSGSISPPLASTA